MTIDQWTVNGKRYGHEGWEFRVVLLPDPDSRPETDGDWAGPEDIKAWKDDEWVYVDVDVYAIDGKGRVWEDQRGSLGAVAWGNLPPDTHVGREELERDTLPDVITEIMTEIANAS